MLGQCSCESYKVSENFSLEGTDKGCLICFHTLSQVQFKNPFLLVPNPHYAK